MVPPVSAIIVAQNVILRLRLLIARFSFQCRKVIGSTFTTLRVWLRWLTRGFLRLDSARYHRLPNVSTNRAFTNDASNPKKKGNHFGP